MRILPSCSHVSATVWLHHLDSNKMLGEKARWELHKVAMCCFEQILETALYKTAAVRSLTSHLTNQPGKKNKTCWRSKNELVLLWTPTHRNTSVGQPVKTYIHQVCADIRYRLKDLTKAITNKHGLQERINRILVV